MAYNLALTKTHNNSIGRGTRCYKTYDCVRGKITLFKDSWRVEEYDTEGAISQRKQKQDLVVTSDACDGFLQRSCLSAPPIRNYLRRRTHHRFVLDTIGLPISYFSSTWIMIRAIYCALKGHEMAYKLAGILHKDISVSNILILANGTGILVDWELSKDVDKAPKTYQRAGTWQFLSVRLTSVRNSNLLAIPDVSDDLEAFVHVMVWLAARYAPNKMDPSLRGTFLAVFDAPEGNDSKESRMLNGKKCIRRLKLAERHLRSLLGDLWYTFGLQYDDDEKDDGVESDTGSSNRWGDEADGGRQRKDMGEEKESQSRPSTFVSERQRVLDRISSHDWMLETMRKALTSQRWQETQDCAVNHPLASRIRRVGYGDTLDGKVDADGV